MADHYCPNCREKVNWITTMVRERFHPYCSQECQWEHQVELAQREATPEGRAALFESNADDEARQQIVMEMLSRPADEFEPFLGELSPMGWRILAEILATLFADPEKAPAAALSVLQLALFLEKDAEHFWPQFERLLTLGRSDFIAALSTVCCAGERAAPWATDLLAIGLIVNEAREDRAAALWRMLFTRPGWITDPIWRALCLAATDGAFAEIALGHICGGDAASRELVVYVLAVLEQNGWQIPTPLRLQLAARDDDPRRLVALGDAAVEVLLARAADTEAAGKWFDAFLKVAATAQHQQVIERLLESFETLRYARKVVALDRLSALGWQPMILGDDLSAFMQVHDAYGDDFVCLLNAGSELEATAIAGRLRALPATAAYLSPLLQLELEATAMELQPWHGAALDWIASDDLPQAIDLYLRFPALREMAAQSLKPVAGVDRAVEAQIARLSDRDAQSTQLPLLRELQAALLL